MNLTGGELIVLMIFILFVYVLAYALLDRICKCCEHCASAKSFGMVKSTEILQGMVPQQPVSRQGDERCGNK